MASSAGLPTPAQLKQLLDAPATYPPTGGIPSLSSPPNIDTVCYLTLSLCVGFASLAVAIRVYTKRFIIHSITYDDCKFSIFVADVSPILTIPDACMIGLVRAQPNQLESLLALSINWTDRPMGAVGSRPCSLNEMARESMHGTYDSLPSPEFFTCGHLPPWYPDFTNRAVSGLTSLRLSTLPIFSSSSFLFCFSTPGSSSLRIFVPNRRANLPLFVAIQVCIWTIFSFSVIWLFLNIFMCNPREKLWNPLITNVHCFNIDFNCESSGIFNAISDFAILILPMPCLWKLQMPLRKKLLVMGVFATGLL